MNILLLLLIVSIVLIFLSIKMTCPPNRIEYRYLPRTLDHYTKDAAFSTDDVMQTMTDDNGNVWLENASKNKLK